MEMSTGGYSWIRTFTAAAIRSKKASSSRPNSVHDLLITNTQESKGVLRLGFSAPGSSKKCDQLIQSIEYRPEKNCFKL
jgi:hypothetical protein